MSGWRTTPVLAVAMIAWGAACNSPRATPDPSAASASAAAPAQLQQSPQVAMREATIPIEGMSCGSCVANIKRHLKSTPGVFEIDVSLEHRNAIVRYDEAKVSPERLVAAINDLGYTAGAATVTPNAGAAR